MRKENSVEIELVFCNSFKSKSIKGVKWLTLDFERESSEVFGYLELGILGTGNKSQKSGKLNYGFFETPKYHKCTPVHFLKPYCVIAFSYL